METPASRATSSMVTFIGTPPHRRRCADLPSWRCSIPNIGPIHCTLCRLFGMACGIPLRSRRTDGGPLWHRLLPSRYVRKVCWARPARGGAGRRRTGDSDGKGYAMAIAASRPGWTTLTRRGLLTGAPALLLGLSSRRALAVPGTPAVSPPPSITVTRNVVYATPDGVSLALDVYAPAGGPYPGVVVIHGGGWSSGDKGQWVAEGTNLARAGFVAFVINYRLAPPGGHWHFPAAADDVRAAVRWVRAHALASHADPARIGALGGSAGGNLALLLATTGQEGGDRVEGAVSWW